MFDSDNIPLVTRLESGNGLVDISFNVNSEGEGVYNVTVDSDKVGAAANASLAARIAVLEARLGIGVDAGDGVVAVDSDQDGRIDLSIAGSAITGQLNVRWEILGRDGREVSSQPITIQAGTSRASILQIIAYSLFATGAPARTYLDGVSYNVDGSTPFLLFTFKSGLEDFQIMIEVTGSTAADNVAFTVRQQVTA